MKTWLIGVIIGIIIISGFFLFNNWNNQRLCGNFYEYEAKISIFFADCLMGCPEGALETSSDCYRSCLIEVNDYDKRISPSKKDYSKICDFEENDLRQLSSKMSDCRKEILNGTRTNECLMLIRENKNLIEK